MHSVIVEAVASVYNIPATDLKYTGGEYVYRNGSTLLNLRLWGGYRYLTGQVSEISGCVNNVCKTDFALMQKLFPFRTRYTALSSELEQLRKQLLASKC